MRYDRFGIPDKKADKEGRHQYGEKYRHKDQLLNNLLHGLIVTDMHKP